MFTLLHADVDCPACKAQLETLTYVISTAKAYCTRCPHGMPLVAWAQHAPYMTRPGFITLMELQLHESGVA